MAIFFGTGRFDPTQAKAEPPARLFTPSYRRDDLGFLDLEWSRPLLSATNLLDHPVVLVTAQPWMGKTRFAKQLRQWLAEAADTSQRFGRFLEMTTFEGGYFRGSISPSWWADWKNAPSGTSACWIVDALDECEHIAPGFWTRLVEEVEGLPSVHRDNLRLLVFSRDRPWLKEFQECLGQCYSAPHTELQALRLAPLERSEAVKLVGSEEAFDRVANLIRQYQLSTIAGYPRVLTLLNENIEGSLSVERVWGAILADLLSETNSARRRPITELEHRFEATARIAVVLTLSDRSEVSGGSTGEHEPTIAEIFPLAGLDSRTVMMREAARESLALAAFCATPNGGHCFLQRNIRDWFCAFGLRGIGVDRLRPFVQDQAGPLPHLVDMLQLLRLVSPDAKVREWLDGTVGPLQHLASDTPWGLSDILHQIDRLEMIAAQSPRHLSFFGDEGLSRLEAPGLGRHLAGRLADTKRSTNARKLMLDIAMETRAPEVVPVAIEVMCDGREDIDLRGWSAVLVRRLGGVVDPAPLEAAVAGLRGRSQPARELRAQIISLLLDRKAWTAGRAAREAPPISEHIVDSRRLLFHQIQGCITLDDARTIARRAVKALVRTRPTPGRRKIRRSGKWPELVPACVGKLAAEPVLSDPDRRLLVRLAFRLWPMQWEHDSTQIIFSRLQADRRGRRMLYATLVGRIARNIFPAPIHWRRVLLWDDREWLRRKAESSWAAQSIVWVDLYLLTREAPAGRWRERAIRSITNRAPQVPEDFERARRQAEEEDREIAERRSGRREVPAERASLDEITGRVLGQTDWSAADRMRQLALLCLSGEFYSYSNVDGKWADLDEARQAEVLRVCRLGLDEATPTELPGRRKFTTLNYAEGRAFARLATDPANAMWLDGSLIARWLPVVVRTDLPQCVEVLIACGKADHAATAEVLIAAVEQDLRSGEEHAMTAVYIPADLWPGPIASRLVAFVEDESFELGARVGLLDVLAKEESAAALPMVIRFMDGDARLGVPEALRRRVLDILIRTDTARAIPFIEEEFDLGGPDALLALSSLHFHCSDFKPDIDAWPTERLVRLAVILLRAQPLSKASVDTSGRAEWMTMEHELRFTRDRIIGILLGRQDDADRAAMDPLIQLEPSLAERATRVRAQREADRIVNAIPAAPRVTTQDIRTPMISPGSVVRLLDEDNYRLIRTDDDLLAAVVAVLDWIERDAQNDLSMLYGRPELVDETARPSGSPGKEKRGKSEASKARKRLGEDALQAYIRRRLYDLMPAYVPGVEVQIIREAQVQRDRRLDLLITAPTLQRSQAVVIVEIKWSDNKETRTSLIDQLAYKYLRDEGRTHGIYLVGWMGEWQPGKGLPKDLDSLKSLLTQQVANFEVNAEHQPLVIKPVVIDLRWRDED